jgi:hypothetical protein
MNKESTTFFNYNSDNFSSSDFVLKKLVTRPLWFVSCFINNIFSGLIKDKKLKTLKFKYSKNDILKNKDLLPKSTPSRILCDLFWIKLDYQKFLDGNGFLNIVDFGCGSCLYYERLKRYSNQKINYVGIDIYKNDSVSKYEDLDNFRFIKMSEFCQKSFIEVLNKYNIKLIISQSVLEHISNDLKTLNFINKAVLFSKKQITQFHMVPSAESIFHYFMHGVRQYTPRTISNFTLSLPESFRRHVISIGGKHSSRYFTFYHFWFRFLLKFRILNNSDIKVWLHDDKNRSYKLYKALEKDIIDVSPKALFYCIQISIK